MKQTITLLLILMMTNSFGQTNLNDSTKTEKTLLIVCLKSQGSCGYKALRITGTIIQIDTCYNIKDKVFSVDRIDSVKANNLYAILFNLTSSQWKQIQYDINQINNCDSLAPFEIDLTENKKVETFSLNRIMNCYPSSGKKVLEGLDNYFNQLQ